MVLPDDEMRILEFMCNRKGPTPLPDILKGIPLLEGDKVPEVLMRMLEEGLIQEAGMLSYVPAYTLTDLAREKIVRDFLKMVSSMRHVISPYAVSIEIMKASIEEAKTPEEAAEQVREFEKMIQSLEEWNSQRSEGGS